MSRCVRSRGRRQKSLDALRDEFGDAVTPIRADAAESEDIATVFAAVAERGRGLDAVHADAGGGEFKSLDTVTAEDFEATFGTNVRVVTLTVQGALPVLHEGSAVVVTGSTAASGTEPSFGLYGASKGHDCDPHPYVGGQARAARRPHQHRRPRPTETPGLVHTPRPEPDPDPEQFAGITVTDAEAIRTEASCARRD